MGALLIAAALTQAANPTGSTAPTSNPGTEPAIHSGETNYLDIEAGAGYSSNSLLSAVNSKGSLFGRISLQAVHSRVSARSTTLLSGFAENDSYTNHYGSLQSVSLSGRHDASISEHARLFIDGSATYQEGGQLDTRVLAVPIVPPVIPGGVVTPPILTIPGADFLSVTGKEYTYSGHVGGAFALSPRDSLSLTSGFEHVIVHTGATRTSYTTIPVVLDYSRELSERTRLGARVTGTDTEYSGAGSVRVVTPQLTARTMLAERVSLDGAVGVSIARVDDGTRVRHTTGFSGQANLCGQGETSYFCGNVYVDEQAATAVGPARSIGGGLTYSQRLDADQSIQFSLGVTHYSTPTSVITAQNFSSSTYFHAAGSYSRRFASRFFGGVNLAVRKLTQNGPDPTTDFNASLFIRYRLGDIQ